MNARVPLPILGLMLALLVTVPGPGAAAPAGKPALAIVYQGGPSLADGGQKLIDQFAEHLASRIGLPSGGLEAAYFNDQKPAQAWIATREDAFVMGSLGFYLSNRKRLGLVPLARRLLAGGADDRFYLMTARGSGASLAGLKGKRLAGSVLLNDPLFLRLFAFEGAVDPAVHFVLQPTDRPLSALRRLTTGGIDAVLIDEVQRQSLSGLPLTEKIEAVHTSKPFPTLGFMMTDTPVTRGLRDRAVAAVVGVCGEAKGREICDSFGLIGFEPVAAGSLDEAVRRYDAASR